MVDRSGGERSALTGTSRITPLARSIGLLSDEVERVLRDEILAGTLAPGTPLLQIQLAEQLGVSRTPLREALRILERDGLVKVSNGNKTVEVVALDIAEIVATHEVREVVDGLAARLAARRGLGPEADRHLVACIDAMDTASRGGLDTAVYGDAHADFHLSIIDATGNSRLLDLCPLVRLSSQMMLTRYLQQQAHRHPGLVDLEGVSSTLINEGNQDHRRIYAAIAAGQPREAEAAAKRHIRKTADFATRLHEKIAAATATRSA